MKFENYIIKAGDFVSDLVAGGLAVHGAYNLLNGNYKFALAEGIVAFYIKVRNEFERRTREGTTDLLKLIEHHQTQSLPAIENISIKVMIPVQKREYPSTKKFLDLEDTLLPINYFGK